MLKMGSVGDQKEEGVMRKKRFVIAVTGTTGVELGVRLIAAVLEKAGVYAVFSNSAIPIISDELGINVKNGIKEAVTGFLKERYNIRFNDEDLSFFSNENLWAPISSGSFRTDGMFIVPCSMKTLSAVANGYAEGLIERAADVTIKEGRPLVICPRETPFSVIHLENMLKLAKLGVRVVPPVFGTYHGRRDMEGMIDFIVGKLLDQMGIDNNLYNRWKGRG